MSLQDDDTSNLPELTPVSSNQHVKKAIQSGKDGIDDGEDDFEK